MLKDEIIKETLNHNKLFKSDILNVETNNNLTIIVNYYNIAFYVLSNFVITYSLTETETSAFLRNTLCKILDIVSTEVEIKILEFSNIYKEENTNIIELHNKDECWLAVAIQGKVNKRLEKNIQN